MSHRACHPVTGNLFIHFVYMQFRPENSLKNVWWIVKKCVNLLPFLEIM